MIFAGHIWAFKALGDWIENGVHGWVYGLFWGRGRGREGYDTRSVASGWLAEQCLSIERESEGCINDMMPDGIF